MSDEQNRRKQEHADTMLQISELEEKIKIAKAELSQLAYEYDMIREMVEVVNNGMGKTKVKAKSLHLDATGMISLEGIMVHYTQYDDIVRAIDQSTYTQAKELKKMSKETAGTLILEALQQVGGANYLAQKAITHPREFMKLVGIIAPRFKAIEQRAIEGPVNDTNKWTVEFIDKVQPVPDFMNSEDVISDQ